MTRVGVKNSEEVVERQMLVSAPEVDVSEVSEVSGFQTFRAHILISQAWRDDAYCPPRLSNCPLG